jgi:hypothetical protein
VLRSLLSRWAPCGWSSGDAVRAVLGIDAAWTLTEPSGVAFVVEDRGWRLAAVAPSYDAFLRTAGGDPPWPVRPRGSAPDAGALITAARTISKSAVEFVAIDMPLSREPITSRRASDRAVNATYSARWCSTHTPSAVRPGKISDMFAAGGDNGIQWIVRGPRLGLGSTLVQLHGLRSIPPLL